ncbi:unnamed protein product [Symbiodinium sp. CCMP2592]|nr:unnamed protein product [Symbiodinium sp. CCMP2592]
MLDSEMHYERKYPTLPGANNSRYIPNCPFNTIHREDHGTTRPKVISKLHGEINSRTWLTARRKTGTRKPMPGEFCNTATSRDHDVTLPQTACTYGGRISENQCIACPKIKELNTLQLDSQVIRYPPYYTIRPKTSGAKHAGKTGEDRTQTVNEHPTMIHRKIREHNYMLSKPYDKPLLITVLPAAAFDEPFLAHDAIEDPGYMEDTELIRNHFGRAWFRHWQRRQTPDSTDARLDQHAQHLVDEIAYVVHLAWWREGTMTSHGQPMRRCGCLDMDWEDDDDTSNSEDTASEHSRSRSRSPPPLTTAERDRLYNYRHHAERPPRPGGAHIHNASASCSGNALWKWQGQTTSPPTPPTPTPWTMTSSTPGDSTTDGYIDTEETWLMADRAKIPANKRSPTRLWKELPESRKSSSTCVLRPPWKRQNNPPLKPRPPSQSPPKCRPGPKKRPQPRGGEVAAPATPPTAPTDHPEESEEISRDDAVAIWQSLLEMESHEALAPAEVPVLPALAADNIVETLVDKPEPVHNALLDALPYFLGRLQVDIADAVDRARKLRQQMKEGTDGGASASTAAPRQRPPPSAYETEEDGNEDDENIYMQTSMSSKAKTPDTVSSSTPKSMMSLLQEHDGPLLADRAQFESLFVAYCDEVPEAPEADALILESAWVTTWWRRICGYPELSNEDIDKAMEDMEEPDDRLDRQAQEAHENAMEAQYIQHLQEAAAKHTGTLLAEQAKEQDAKVIDAAGGWSWRPPSKRLRIGVCIDDGTKSQAWDWELDAGHTFQLHVKASKLDEPGTWLHRGVPAPLQHVPPELRDPPRPPAPLAPRAPRTYDLHRPATRELFRRWKEGLISDQSVVSASDTGMLNFFRGVADIPPEVFEELDNLDTFSLQAPQEAGEQQAAASTSSPAGQTAENTIDTADRETVLLPPTPNTLAPALDMQLQQEDGDAQSNPDLYYNSCRWLEEHGAVPDGAERDDRRLVARVASAASVLRQRAPQLSSWEIEAALPVMENAAKDICDLWHQLRNKLEIRLRSERWRSLAKEMSLSDELVEKLEVMHVETQSFGVPGLTVIPPPPVHPPPPPPAAATAAAPTGAAPTGAAPTAGAGAAPPAMPPMPPIPNIFGLPIPLPVPAGPAGGPAAILPGQPSQVPGGAVPMAPMPPGTLQTPLILPMPLVNPAGPQAAPAAPAGPAGPGVATPAVAAATAIASSTAQQVAGVVHQLINQVMQAGPNGGAGGAGAAGPPPTGPPPGLGGLRDSLRLNVIRVLHFSLGDQRIAGRLHLGIESEVQRETQGDRTTSPARPDILCVEVELATGDDAFKPLAAAHRMVQFSPPGADGSRSFGPWTCTDKREVERRWLEMRAKALGVLGLSLELKQFMRLMAGLLGAALLVEPVSHRRLWQGLKTVSGPSQSARLRIGLGGLGLAGLAEQVQNARPFPDMDNGSLPLGPAELLSHPPFSDFV